MIKHLAHHEIDISKWDACIDASSIGLVYAKSWMLNILAPDWDALVFNDYEAIMPLPHQKKIVEVVYQPFFIQQLGVIKKHEGVPVSTNNFIEAIPYQFKYINICLNESNTYQSNKHQVISRSNYLLHLHLPYDQLFKNYNDHTRRNLKKAQQHPLSLQTCDTDFVVAYYAQHKGTETPEVKEADYDRLKQALQQAHLHKSVTGFAVYEKEQVLATMALLKTKNRLVYYLGCSNEEGREKRAMYFLVDELIKIYHNQSLIFDFEGSDITGIARFFKGFGAMRLSYTRVIINRLPWYLKWLKK